jgi:hypothetical protein
MQMKKSGTDVPTTKRSKINVCSRVWFAKVKEDGGFPKNSRISFFVQSELLDSFSYVAKISNVDMSYLKVFQ